MIILHQSSRLSWLVPSMRVPWGGKTSGYGWSGVFTAIYSDRVVSLSVEIGPSGSTAGAAFFKLHSCYRVFYFLSGSKRITRSNMVIWMYHAKFHQVSRERRAWDKPKVLPIISITWRTLLWVNSLASFCCSAALRLAPQIMRSKHHNLVFNV